MTSKSTTHRPDALAYHAAPVPGKIALRTTKPCLTQHDLSLAYTPGVAEPCLAIKDEPDAVWQYTARGNLVAVVSDGTAVLGLGNIGPAAGLPVMEGKAVLFKRFADIDAFPLCLDHVFTPEGRTDADRLIETVLRLAPTFGGGANSLVSEMLGDDAIISSDFGGNPPYAKMKELARICYRYWLPQTNVLFIIGGKANNTDIFETFRAMADGLREYYAQHGPTPLYAVVGRGGPNLIRGMGVLRDTFESLKIPYKMFGFDSDMSEVINYARAADAWMKASGREQIARQQHALVG